MVIIVVIGLLAVLKFAGIEFLAELSWWWIAGLFAVAFIWFEFVEPTFGLDKRRVHEHADQIRKDRVKKAFEQTGRARRK